MGGARVKMRVGPGCGWAGCVCGVRGDGRWVGGWVEVVVARAGVLVGSAGLSVAPHTVLEGGGCPSRTSHTHIHMRTF